MFGKTKPIGFRKFVTLEKRKQIFLSATGDESFPEKVFSYLSVALDVPVSRLEGKDWQKVIRSLLSYKGHQLKPLPLLEGAQKDSKPVDWDYDGRSWAYYSHLLSKAYGWTLEYIAEMDVDEALSHLQEILTDEHLDREFLYSLSEVAYPFNASTKKSEFKPMKRPYWMQPAVPTTIKKVKIRRDMLPQGLIKDMSGLPSEFQIPELHAEKG